MAGQLIQVDGKLSAQFEHTHLGCTDKGVEIIAY